MTSAEARRVRYWEVRPVMIPARILLAVGALAASVAFWAFSAQRTILDPAATRDLATQLINTDAVAGSLTDQLAGQLEQRIPDDLATQVPAGALTKIAQTAISDPRVATAFGDTIASLHEQLLAGTAGDDVAIDTRAINAALGDALHEVNPELALEIGSAEPVALSIDSGRIPNLQPVDDGARDLLLGAAILAVIGFGLGVSIHPEPWTAVSIVGKRLAAVAAFPVFLYVVVPAGLRALGSKWSNTMSPFASAYGQRILPAALTLMVGGIALWIGGHVGRRSEPQLPPMERLGPRSRSGRPDPTARFPAAPPGRTDLRL
jgi:hypothetical protein